MHLKCLPEKRLGTPARVGNNNWCRNTLRLLPIMQTLTTGISSTADSLLPPMVSTRPPTSSHGASNNSTKRLPPIRTSFEEIRPTSHIRAVAFSKSVIERHKTSRPFSARYQGTGIQVKRQLSATRQGGTLQRPTTAIGDTRVICSLI